MMTGEPRRIELTTVETGKKEKEKPKARKSVRFHLTLTETNEEACPEFSYVELLKNALGDDKKKKKEAGKEKPGDPFKQLDPDDPFAAQDDAEHEKMLAIARSFETKYGCIGKKKRKDRPEDLVDLGEGYDEEDPFIDNTEAYDELVPACLTTRFGGFYINSGKLDFREVSDDDEDFQPMQKKKKRQVIGSDDDELERPDLGLDGKKKRGRKKKFKDEDDLIRRKRKKWAMASGEAGKLLKKRKLSGAKLGRPSSRKKFKTKGAPRKACSPGEIGAIGAGSTFTLESSLSTTMKGSAQSNKGTQGTVSQPQRKVVNSHRKKTCAPDKLSSQASCRESLYSVQGTLPSDSIQDVVIATSLLSPPSTKKMPMLKEISPTPKPSMSRSDPQTVPLTSNSHSSQQDNSNMPVLHHYCEPFEIELTDTGKETSTDKGICVQPSQPDYKGFVRRTSGERKTKYIIINSATSGRENDLQNSETADNTKEKNRTQKQPQPKKSMSMHKESPLTIDMSVSVQPKNENKPKKKTQQRNKPGNVKNATHNLVLPTKTLDKCGKAVNNSDQENTIQAQNKSVRSPPVPIHNFKRKVNLKARRLELSRQVPQDQGTHVVREKKLAPEVNQLDGPTEHNVMSLFDGVVSIEDPTPTEGTFASNFIELQTDMPELCQLYEDNGDFVTLPVMKTSKLKLTPSKSYQLSGTPSKSYQSSGSSLQSETTPTSSSNRSTAKSTQPSSSDRSTAKTTLPSSSDRSTVKPTSTSSSNRSTAKSTQPSSSDRSTAKTTLPSSSDRSTVKTTPASSSNCSTAKNTQTSSSNSSTSETTLPSSSDRRTTKSTQSSSSNSSPAKTTAYSSSNRTTVNVSKQVNQEVSEGTRQNVDYGSQLKKSHSPNHTAPAKQNRAVPKQSIHKTHGRAKSADGQRRTSGERKTKYIIINSATSGRENDLQNSETADNTKEKNRTQKQPQPKKSMSMHKESPLTIDMSVSVQPKNENKPKKKTQQRNKPGNVKNATHDLVLPTKTLDKCGKAVNNSDQENTIQAQNKSVRSPPVPIHNFKRKVNLKARRLELSRQVPQDQGTHVVREKKLAPEVNQLDGPTEHNVMSLFDGVVSIEDPMPTEGTFASNFDELQTDMPELCQLYEDNGDFVTLPAMKTSKLKLTPSKSYQLSGTPSKSYQSSGSSLQSETTPTSSSARSTTKATQLSFSNCSTAKTTLPSSSDHSTVKPTETSSSNRSTAKSTQPSSSDRSTTKTTQLSSSNRSTAKTTLPSSSDRSTVKTTPASSSNCSTAKNTQTSSRDRSTAKTTPPSSSNCSTAKTTQSRSSKSSTSETTLPSSSDFRTTKSTQSSSSNSRPAKTTAYSSSNRTTVNVSKQVNQEVSEGTRQNVDYGSQLKKSHSPNHTAPAKQNRAVPKQSIHKTHGRAKSADGQYMNTYNKSPLKATNAARRSLKLKIENILGMTPNIKRSVTPVKCSTKTSSSAVSVNAPQCIVPNVGYHPLIQSISASTNQALKYLTETGVTSPTEPAATSALLSHHTTQHRYMGYVARPKIKHTLTLAERMKMKQQASANGLEKHRVEERLEENKLLLDVSDFGLGVLDPAMDSVINSVLNESNTNDCPSPNPEGREREGGQPPPLPAGVVGSKLEVSIEKIKQKARVTVEGKCKFFKSSVNELLLDIELRSRQLSSSGRNAIYSHLAYYLPCGKETLLKRAKRLREDQEEEGRAEANHYIEPIERLREEINRVMPGLIERYNETCAVAAQRQQEERAENKEMGSTESEDDKSNDFGITDKRRLPHRKFEWSPKIKNLVNEIVRMKIDYYERLSNPTESAEQYLRAFLDAEIKPLWPKGWMQTRMIYKETRGVHGRLTKELPKSQRKPGFYPMNKTFASTSAMITENSLLDNIPDYDFETGAPLPGGLVTSGTGPKSPHSSISLLVGGHTGSGTPATVKSTHSELIRSGTEPFDIEEKLTLNSMLATPISAATSSHLSSKSLPGTPASTSTPAQATSGGINRTLLDYASESFSGAKSKAGMLSMGTVLPDSVSLTTTSPHSSVSFTTTAASETAATSSASMLTPATDSLRNISNILKKEVPGDIMESQHVLSTQQQSQRPHTADSEPKMPSPPLNRISASSYQSSSSSMSSRPGNERYLNQYKEYVGQLQKQQQQQASTPLSSSTTKPYDNTKKTSPTSAGTNISQKTSWDVKSPVGVTAGLHNPVSSSVSGLTHKTPSTQTQVHQVSSSLSKTQVNHGLKLNITGSNPAQTITMGQQRISPSQTQTNQQRHAQSQNLSFNQRSPQNQAHTVSQQSRSYQQNYKTVVVPPSSPTPRAANVASIGTGLVSSMSRTTQQVAGHTVMSRSPQMTKTSAASGGHVHSPSKGLIPSSPVAPPSPTVSYGSQSLGFSAPKHPASPGTGSAAYKISANKPVVSAHNGGQRGHMTSPDPSTTAGLSHILDSEAKKQKNKSPQDNDIIYSSLTMAEILASSPTDSHKNYGAASSSSTESGMWGRTSNHVKPTSRQQHTGMTSPVIPSPPSPSQPLPKSAMAVVSSASSHYGLPVVRTAQTTTNMFIPPTSTALHSGLRLADLQRDRLSGTAGLQLTHGNMAAYSHGSSVSTTPSPMSVGTPSPHHPQSPQSRVTSPRQQLYHPTVAPFGYQYTDPNQQQQHRY